MEVHDIILPKRQVGNNDTENAIYLFHNNV